MNVQPKLTLTPSHAAVLSGQKATAWVQIAVTAADAPAQEQSERKPIDVQLVLDCSGSMSGEKIRQAKLAMQYVLGQLTAADRAGIIVFGSCVETFTELTHDHQASVGATDRASSNMGLTALAPALMTALDKLDGGSDSSRTRHVFLLSDGDANVGETDPKVIAAQVEVFAAKGIHVSTFGLGADYNELLMEAIAVAGQGGYHYLASADDAPAAFAAELEGLMRTTLHDSKLQISVPRGVEILRLLGTDTAAGEPITIGDVPAGAERYVLAEVSFAASKAKSRGLLSVKLTGRAGLDGVDVVAVDQAAKVAQTSVESDVTGGVNASVLARVAELEAAQAQREAALAADRGDFAGAQQLLRAARGNVEATLAFADADASLFLTAKIGDLDTNLQGVQSFASYSDGAVSKQMRVSSYRSRTSR